MVAKGGSTVLDIEKVNKMNISDDDFVVILVSILVGVGMAQRALTSHQCGPGSIPGLGVICGLSLLLVLVPAPRVFLWVLQFSSLHKNQHFQIPICPGNSGEKSHSVDSTEIPIITLCARMVNNCLFI